MRYLDLHGLTWAEARETVVEAYNRSVTDRSFDTLDVVHGYGAGGHGGKIHTALRSFLTKQGVAFRTGEELDHNPGHTVIYPEHPLPSVTDRLQMDILAYCEAPKTKEQIAGKYRRRGAPEVDAAIKDLVGSKLLTVVLHGRVKRYTASG